MSTRCNIIAKLSSDKWGCIYCHFDGYPSGAGRTLQKHYTTQEKVDSLIALGDLSGLEAEIGPRPEGDKRNIYCFAYGRDGAETGTEAEYGVSLFDVWLGRTGGAEYVYIWDNGAWSMGRPGNARDLRPLAEVLSDPASD